MNPVRIGVVGCGAISGVYLWMAKSFPSLVQVVACSDIDVGRAKAKAKEFGIPKGTSVDDMLRDDSIELVLNLTVPKAHAAVAIAALQAGKHTYAEKPLGVTREEGQRVIDLAKSKGLLVGCAPDTFMGAGIQTARKLVDDGAIGRPVAFTAFMMCPGHEHWHMSPEFYYEKGGGPMFDMGPYYLTALLNILGPVKRITGAATITSAQRPITHRDKEGRPGPKFGRMMTVETPDHVCGTVEFANACTGVIVQSFATHKPQHNWNHPITIYGTEGTLLVPDPNIFDGDVYMARKDDKEFAKMPHTFVKGYGRSVGAADMACAIRSARPFRATGEQGMAVLDLMAGFLDSAESGRAYEPVVKYNRPSAMRAELPFGVLEQ